MPCIRCGSKDYTRSRAAARMVRSVRFACRNREHGCGASLPRLGVEDHKRSCRYEPCFCPVCKRAFVPGADPDALEEHLTGRHAWHLHHLTYGEEVLVDVDPHRHALLRADDGELFHLDLSRVRRAHADDDGTSISVIRMRPDNAAGAEAEFSYEVKPPGAAWRMQAPVWSSSLRRGMEDGNRVFVTVPEARRHRHLVNVCIWRLPARS
ncbi:uncharacterized protein [Triticum aestivum]|uniref:uncharacterized protein n=1 Tax=Triticum aestivum TaxID=4565 RepID=UPI001D0105D0|nr:uncharacterized protein LOC123064392 [Triticum aestivum]